MFRHHLSYHLHRGFDDVGNSICILGEVSNKSSVGCDGKSIAGVGGNRGTTFSPVDKLSNLNAGVAMTVAEAPELNVPPPLTVPPATGLAVTPYSISNLAEVGNKSSVGCNGKMYSWRLWKQ